MKEHNLKNPEINFSKFGQQNKKVFSKKCIQMALLGLLIFIVPNLNAQTNLALNKTAKASSQTSTTYSATKAVDGITTTQWRSTSQTNPWIYVDLGSIQAINKVNLTWSTYFGSAYQIQTSNDGVTWTTIKTVTGENGATDSHTGLTGSGRYIRIYVTTRSNTTKGVYLTEMAVYYLDTQAPTTPISLSSSAISQTSFTLSWSASTDNVAVTSYEVFQNGVSIGTTATTSINVSGLTAGTSYSMTVKAKDAAGNISAASAALNVTTVASVINSISITSPISGQVVAPNSTLDVTVSFTGAVSSVSYWTIYNGVWSWFSQISNSPFNTTWTATATPGSYIVHARATYSDNSTIDSEIPFTIADNQAPTVPTSLSSSAVSETSFTFSWAASTDNVGVALYEVFQNGVSIGTTAATSINVSGLTAGTSYSMTVKAKDAAANVSATSSALNVTTASPVAKSITITSPTSGQIVVPNANLDVTVNVTGGTVSSVTYWIDSYSWIGQVSVSPFTLAWTANVAAGSHVLLARVTYSDNSTLDAISVPFTIGTDPDTQAPTAPTSLTSSLITANTFTLSWTASTDNVGVVSYEVFQNVVSIGTTATTSINVSGLNANTSYPMTVKAKDAAGNVSAASSVLNVTTTVTDTQAPSAPTSLNSSNITSSSFSLSWTASTDNVGVASYDIYANGVLKSNVTNTSATISGLAALTSYAMTVKAKDAAGNISAVSASINVNTIAVPVTNTNHYIGMNLSWSCDWSPDRPFADVMKISREWCKVGHAGDALYYANVDVNGWPTEDAVIVVYDGVSMNGTYKLSFTGQATITCGMAAGGSVSNKVYNSSTNTTTADIIIANSWGALTLEFTGTSGGVKAVKMMRPKTVGGSDCYTTETFTNEIKAMASKVDVIRYMDFNSISQYGGGNPDVNWSDRKKITDASQNVKIINGVNKDLGAAWEYDIQFANETNTDMMINIPLKATDDYVTQLATLIKNNLNSTLKVYIEYSNEVWNSGGPFPANQLHELAIAEVNAGGSSLNYDGETNDWVWAWRYAAKRSMQISNIFRTVFSDAAMMTRVRPNLAWQQGNGQGFASNMLDFLFKYYGSSAHVSTPHLPNYFFYSGGGSAYYSPDNHSDALTIDNIWTNTAFSTTNWTNDIKPDIDYCATFGLKYVCYEGGPSLDKVYHSESVKAAAVNDPRMKTCILDHQTTYDNYGGELLMYYRGTGDYQWGFSENSLNLNTVKWSAIDDIQSTNKADVTYGTLAPATLNGSAKVFDIGNFGWSNGTTYHLKEHHYAGYIFRVSTAGTYNVSANISGQGSISFYCDGSLVGTEPVVNGNTSTFTISNLQPGIHGIIIKSSDASGDGFDLNTVTIGAGSGTKSAIKSAIENTVVSQNNIDELLLYPNPVLDRLNLNFGATVDEVEIRVLDLQGRNLMTKTVANTQLETLDISSLNNGVYFVKVTANGKVMNRKFVKK